MSAAVYAQTNDATDNEVLAYRRADDGALTLQDRYSTGGRGTGEPHLPSQSSVALSDDGRWLLVVNPGSDELSVFAVEPEGLRPTGRVASGGSTPTSVACHGDLAYVLNNGTPNISGFRLVDGAPGSAGGLGAAAEQRRRRPGADRVQPPTARRCSQRSGAPTASAATPSTRTGTRTDRRRSSPPARRRTASTSRPTATLVVTEAFGGAIGAAAASSYAVDGSGGLTPVSGSVGDTRSEVCWAAVTNDGRFAYVTNFGDGTVSPTRSAATAASRYARRLRPRRARARRAFAMRHYPATAATCTRSTPTPRRCSGGRSVRTAS